MAPLAHLLLAACALAAPLHAASIREPASDLQKKIPAVVPEDIKAPLETNPDHEIADLNDPVKEIENKLRVKPAEDIPVEVVIEDVAPSLKINEVAYDDEIKRPEADLRNPGPPQRQEHETQNPEQHADEQLKVSTIKENIKEAQILLRQSFQDVTNDIQTWLPHDESPTKIQQNIQKLRETFSNQIQKLYDTVQTLAKPETSKPAEEQKVVQEDYRNIESRLKILEDNFNNGVETLSAGVNLVANLKSVGEESDVERQEAAVQSDAPSSPVPPASLAQPGPEKPTTAAPATSPQGLLVQLVGTLGDRMQSVMQSMQSFWTPSTTPSPSTSSPPANVQADIVSSSARPPFVWQFPQLPVWNLSNLTSMFNTSALPFLNILGQQPQFLGFLNLPGSSSTAKPAEAAGAGGKPAAVNTSVEPKPEGQSDKPVESVAASQPAAEPAAQPNGPIRQIFQGFNSAVQRIQNSITNPERPREPSEKSDGNLKKGGWYGRPGNQGVSGDNNDSGLSEKSDEKEVETIEETEDVKEEVKPEPVLEKTE